ncbi:hypothetical protein D3C80_1238210 [compost metagenome]
MAHDGEEFRFGLIGLFGRFLGADDLLLIGNITEDDNRSDTLAFIKQRGYLILGQKA